MNRRPARRDVAGAEEALRVHESLREQHRMTEQRLHVGGQAACGKGERPGGEVGQPPRRQNKKAAVVGHQPQAAEPLLRGPGVPGLDPEGLGAPAEQGQPGSVRRRHMPKAAAEHAPEAQVVPVIHRPVPALPLHRVGNGADGHPGKREPRTARRAPLLALSARRHARL